MIREIIFGAIIGLIVEVKRNIWKCTVHRYIHQVYLRFFFSFLRWIVYVYICIYGKYLFPALIISCVSQLEWFINLYPNHIIFVRSEEMLIDVLWLLSTTKCNRLFIESTLVRYLDIVFTDENVVETFDIVNDFNYPLSIDMYIFFKYLRY